jgi:hypothetical protein
MTSPAPILMSRYTEAQGAISPADAIPSTAHITPSLPASDTPNLPAVPPAIQAIFTAFATRIEAGDTIRQALRHDDVRGSNDALPWVSITTWLTRYPTIAAQYARARIGSAQFYADEAVEVARQSFGMFGADNKLGVQAATLRVNTAKWRASVADPKRYGATIDVTSDGERIRGVVALPAELPPTDVVDLQEGTDYTITAL